MQENIFRQSVWCISKRKDFEIIGLRLKSLLAT